METCLPRYYSCVSTSVRQYVSTPVRQYVSTSVRQYAIYAVWLQYVSTSVRQYASTSVRQYVSTPVRQYVMLPKLYKPQQSLIGLVTETCPISVCRNRMIQYMVLNPTVVGDDQSPWSLSVVVSIAPSLKFCLSLQQANKAIIVASNKRPAYACKNLQVVQVNSMDGLAFPCCTCY
jgi:hypothetical protein